jgi:hypoxanthine phosphoribosyltransferase
MIHVQGKPFQILISQETIENRIKVLSEDFSHDYAGKNPLFIGVLNGSFMFAAELLKNCKIDAEITFIRVSSYVNTNSSGKVIDVLGLVENIENREVIIVEDIVDTGITISEIIRQFSDKKPKSIEIATLLFKPKALQKQVNVKYIGFEIEPKFVIGYGLDYDGQGRNLSDIYVLKEN